MKYPNVLRAAALVAVMAGGGVIALAQGNHGPVAATTVTGATGSITQLNYGENGGAPNGFLVGANILLTFPGNVCGGIGALGTAGNGITYSGTSVTDASGFQTVGVTSFTNNTTSAKWAKATPVKPAAYGPVAGTVKQLNYGPQGTPDGFVLTPGTGGAAVFVGLGNPSSATETTLKPLLTVGAAVSVTGTSEPAPACAETGTLAAVNASSLVFGTTTVKIGGGR